MAENQFSPEKVRKQINFIPMQKERQNCLSLYYLLSQFIKP